jgi:cytochrome c553
MKDMRHQRVLPDEAWRALQNYRILYSLFDLQRVGLRDTCRRSRSHALGHGRACTSLYVLPRCAGTRAQQRLLSAHRRQTCGLPVQPVDLVSRRRPHLSFLPDDYLRKISQYFADLQPPYPNADTGDVSPAVLAYGQRLVTHGDPVRKLPACAACHGARLTGTQPGIPGLLGLHASYIAGQMGTWRSGTRHAIAPDCMHSIAVKLTDKDITAVSSWLARQPRPDDPRPAPVTNAALPLACGSQPQ